MFTCELVYAIISEKYKRSKNMCTESMSQIDMLNMIYEPIVNKKDELYNTLIEKGYNINWGYFTHHMLRRDNELFTELYPIPVLSIVNICDIGIDVEHIFIEGKLSKADAKKLTFRCLTAMTLTYTRLRTALRTITRPPAASFQRR